MDKIIQLFSNLRGQVGKSMSSLPMWMKGAVAAVIVIVLVVIVAVVAQRTKTDMDYLYKDLNNEDTQAISEEMKKMGINDFIIDDKGIRVPVDRVMPLRIKLAQEGLPAHGQIGWEKFDQQDFTRTDFEQRINKLRAIQGELARTIRGVDGVISARVHIVTPNKSLFVEDKQEPTAAVYVRTKRGVVLTDKQINGIVHLVSRSVEGLRPELVTIIDHEGKMLTKVESEDPTTKKTQEMLQYKKSLENELENRVRIIVGRTVGPDRVEAKVDVNVDFTTEEQSISDIDPDRVVVLSSSTTNQDMDGNGLNPTGIPGSKSNVPGEQESLTVNQSRAKSSRASERVNYEIAKKSSHRVLPVGEIKRISAAVIVDGTQVYPSDGSKPIFEARTEEEMKKIEELVKSAIGYKEGRDEVKVHNMIFQLSPYQIEAIKENKTENRNYIMTIAVSAAVAVGLVFFFAFIVRPYFSWLSYDPDRKKREALVDEFKPDLEHAEIQNIQVKEDVPFEKLSPQEQILYLAKHEPARTTEALRMLLNPHSVQH
ncbi:MAG: flagellar M-ring protein FliF [Oligoflexales bacterium]|nr:flagellar M-ring protein FliF [Oligoflexales bacterium]